MPPGIEQMMTEAAFKEIELLRAGLAAAHQRECIVVEAYERQQAGQRELEALYQQMTERVQQAEATVAALQEALRLVIGMKTIRGARVVAQEALREDE